MEYSKEESQYYITEEDVLNYSAITSNQIKELAQEYSSSASLLRDIARSVYTFMYSHYRGVRSLEHKRKMEYIIYNGERKKQMQSALRGAQIEWLKGMIFSGMDLYMYTPEGKPYAPESVQQKLREGGLIIKGEITYIHPDLLDGDF